MPEPYKPISPVGSPEFPMADFGDLGRMPKMSDPRMSMVRERGTDQARLMMNGAPLAAEFTDVMGRIGAGMPSRAEQFMQALRSMEGAGMGPGGQQGSTGQQAAMPQVPGMPQQENFQEWGRKRYPQLIDKPIPVAMAKQIYAQYESEQDAARKTSGMEIERYKAILMQRRMEQDREIATEKRQPSQEDLFNMTLDLAKFMKRDDPKNFEALLTALAQQSPQHADVLMKRASQQKRESTRPKKFAPPSKLSEFYARQMSEATSLDKRETAEENYYEARGKEAKADRDDTLTMSEQLADALQKAAKTIPETGKPEPQAMKLVKFYIGQIGEKSAEERGGPQESDVAIVKALTSLVGTLFKGVEMGGLDRDTTLVEIRQLLFQAKKQASQMATGRTVDQIIDQYDGDWNAITKAYYAEHQHHEADPSFQVTITDDILRKIGAQIKGGE